MRVTKDEKMLAATVGIAITIMFIGWGNPLALFSAWLLCAIAGAWWGIQKAKSFLADFEAQQLS